MPPAFDSTKQAAAFALLLMFLLAAPWLASKTVLPRPEQTYSSQSVRFEAYPWVQKFIFEETNNIDIAFIGSSRILHGIDTPYVQQKLEERLGRKAVVRSLAWTWMGFDTLYFFTKDLLAHRQVKTLVFYDECPTANREEFNHFLPKWFRYGDDRGVEAGLPLSSQAVYYYGAMIGTPRNLLELLVSNLPDNPSSAALEYDHMRSPNPGSRLGSMSSLLGYGPDMVNLNTNYTPYLPQTGVTPADILVYTPGTASSFSFSNQPWPVTQTYFAKQFGLLAKSHGCDLVALHMPQIAEKTSSVITESRDWADFMQAEVCLMGIPTGRLFAGLSDQEIKFLFVDPHHLNANGQQYFTSLIMPALTQFYENHSNH